MDEPLLKVLEGVRDLLKVPENWCKGTTELRRYKTLPDGEIIFSNMSYCMLGAIGHCTYTANIENATKTYMDAADVLKDVVGKRIISSWNDDPERKHEEVLAAIDKAIEKVKNG